MLNQFAKSLWEALVFPFVRLQAVLDRRAERRETFRAQGLCAGCGDGPPLEGEDECDACAESNCI